MRIVGRWARRAPVVGASIFIALLGAARAHAQPAPAAAAVTGGFRQGAPSAGLPWRAPRPGSSPFVVARGRGAGAPASPAAGARTRPERRPYPMLAPARLPVRASMRPPTD